MDKRWWPALLLCACSWVALAGGSRSDVRKQTEASMLVTGTIDVAQDGSVSRYALDKPEQLPAAVTGLAGKAVPQWHFQPVMKDGRPVNARAKMSLLLVATPEDDRYRVGIGGAAFGEEKDTSGETVIPKQMRPPSYPDSALHSGVAGTVYLVLRIDRQGKVADAVVEQVNLRAVGREIEMERWRSTLARPALAAAKTWAFTPPSTGDSVNDPFWSVRVPVNFQFEGTEPKYGQWQAYIPGPRQQASWVHDHGFDVGSSPDALVAGGVYQVGAGLRLLTPLDKG